MPAASCATRRCERWFQWWFTAKLSTATDVKVAWLLKDGFEANNFLTLEALLWSVVMKCYRVLSSVFMNLVASATATATATVATTLLHSPPSHLPTFSSSTSALGAQHRFQRKERSCYPTHLQRYRHPTFLVIGFSYLSQSKRK